jgi:hypothetical protein
MMLGIAVMYGRGGVVVGTAGGMGIVVVREG